jgi:small subunit ribosomal protein S17
MKLFTGVVTSTQNAKTARVAVERVMAHPVYRKRVRRTKNYLVHDELGTVVGQRVQFVACKPYSRMKKWKIVEIVGVKKVEKKSTKEVDAPKTVKSEAKDKKVEKKGDKTPKRAVKAKK